MRLVTGPTAEPLHVDAVKDHLRVDTSNEDNYIAGLLTAARKTAETWRGECLVSQTWDLSMDCFPSGRQDIVIPRIPLVSVTSITYTDTNGTEQTFSSDSYIVDTVSKPGRIALAYQQDWPVARDVKNAVTVRFVTGYVTPVSAEDADDTLTPSGRSFTSGTLLRLFLSGSESRAFPSGLAGDTDYYVVGVSGASIQLSLTSGGSAINFTTSGTGQLYASDLPEGIPGNVIPAILLTVGHLYENREAVNVGNIVAEMPMGVAALLNSDRVYQL